MAVSLFTSNATRSRQFLCASCALKLLLPRIARRNISERFLWKTAEAADKWRDQAQEIRAGKKDSMLKILEDRGYINAIVGYIQDHSTGGLNSHGDAETETNSISC